jgi:hypothetical protein
MAVEETWVYATGALLQLFAFFYCFYANMDGLSLIALCVVFYLVMKLDANT